MGMKKGNILEELNFSWKICFELFFGNFVRIILENGKKN